MDRIAVSLFVAILVCSRAQADTLVAFPGALGQGATASGGRGGDVYHVTNLLDYNHKQGEQKIPGSLRHAIRSADGPRTIVFDVSGAIPLAGPLEILKSNLTIAGQTSPAGITLWGYPVEITRASDVIVRHLRIRTGDFHAMKMRDRPARGNGDLRGDDGNTLFVGGGAKRVILDHLSLSWSMDETLSVTGANDVTVQHCLIGESLNDSYHSKGPHGYGSLIRGNLTAEQQGKNSGGYTFYGNLWAHHRARNPSIAGQQRLRRGRSEAQRGRTDLNLVNNVIYGWGDRPSHRSTSGSIRVNLIGNYYVNGPANDGDYIFNEDNPGQTHLYHANNYHDQNGDAAHDGYPTVDRASEFVGFEPDEDILLGPAEAEPFPFVRSVDAAISTAEAAYEQVVNTVGASLHRDAIDQSILSSLLNRTGNLVDSQEAFRDSQGNLAGIDDLPTTRRREGFDVDRDGMADEFERQHGLNPADASDRNRNELGSRGRTNLEVYLDSLIPAMRTVPKENSSNRKP